MSLIPLLFLLKLMAFGTVAFLMTPGPDDGTLFFMPRTARIAIPEIPHHVTQRGNNRQAVFCVNDDRRAYLGILAEETVAANVAAVHVGQAMPPSFPNDLISATAFKPSIRDITTLRRATQTGRPRKDTTT